MLRFLTILTIVLFTHTSNAQTYVPFPTSADTAVWFIASGISPTFGTAYYSIVTYGDTIFDGIGYTKLHYRNNSGEPENYYAAIREENKVIYLRDLANNTIDSDTILFDFNVQVGDTLNWFSYFGDFREVVFIDSVQVSNGSYRKRFNFGVPGEESVIEGIGSNLGFIPTPMIGSGSTRTECYFLNSNFIWSLYGGNDIPCYTSTKQINQNITIKIHPNPTSDNLNIEFENTERRELMIFNPIGQMVLNENSNQMNVVLSLEALPKGFYVLAIRTEDGTFTKKIVKY